MSDVLMSAPLTSDFIYDPHYRTQCVILNAQAAAVPRGTIICAKGAAASLSASAAFEGVDAELTGEAQSYTPRGFVSVTISESGGASADGTFDVIGAENYGTPYGVLLCDAPASDSAQSAEVIVLGECFRAYVDSVYAAANSGNHIPEPVVAALRNVGIFLK